MPKTGGGATRPVGLRVQQLTQIAQKGRAVERLVVEKARKGYRVLVFVNQRGDPFVLEAARGGDRYWQEINGVIRWIETNLPHAKHLELYLQAYLPPQ